MCTSNSTSEIREISIDVPYITCEGIVSLLAIVENIVVIYAYCKNRNLRQYHFYYILALAVVDELMGLVAIPLAVLVSLGLPRNLYACLLTISILLVLCIVSILCFIFVTIDRYWAITNPFSYKRILTTRKVLGVCASIWIVGTILGCLPLFGWYNKEGWCQTGFCFFTDVIDYNYLVFFYFGIIIFPAVAMLVLYGSIYRVILCQIKQTQKMYPAGDNNSMNSFDSAAYASCQTILLRIRQEARAAMKLGIIVFFFMLCWMPLFTINCIQAFCPTCQIPETLLKFTIILSHTNSALDPFLYAYHLPEFRLAMKNTICSFYNSVFKCRIKK